MGRYFGTDGFRGEVNVTLTAVHAYKIGEYLGAYARRGSKDGKPCEVVIGKDTRISGDMLESALAAGLTSAGANVLRLGVTTTPAVAFAVNTFGLQCGIMISASHNPYYDNGIKLFGEHGEKMGGSVIAGIEDYIDGRCALADSPALISRADMGRIFRFAEGGEKYLEFLISNGVNLSGLKVGLDCANGSSYQIAEKVFKALGAAVTVINDKPDGLNINADCGSTRIEGLRELVAKEGLDVGFAYDGDADRCLAVDEKGNVVNGDKILYICGCFLKERGELANNTVVTTVMSNFGLYKAFEAAGIGYAKTAVGDKYVCEYMSDSGCVLGGEQSGHIIFSRCSPTGDGILTSLKLAEVMLVKRAKLSALACGVTDYPQVLINIKVSDKAAAQADKHVREAVKAAERKLGDKGRILVRESGTEPLVRVMVEAEDIGECENLANSVISAIRSGGYERKD
ncbi:MAG: phosphoglucosamine mutase [Clostridia bacterium]|nr:phosphoglucosamine mutase [Clostridia bacterium]